MELMQESVDVPEPMMIPADPSECESVPHHPEELALPAAEGPAANVIRYSTDEEISAGQVFARHKDGDAEDAADLADRVRRTGGLALVPRADGSPAGPGRHPRASTVSTTRARPSTPGAVLAVGPRSRSSTSSSAPACRTDVRACRAPPVSPVRPRTRTSRSSARARAASAR